MSGNVKLFGREDDWENPDDAKAATSGTGVVDRLDHFKPVKLTHRAINEASKIVTPETWKKYGIVKWLQAAADHYYKHMPTDKLEHIILPSPLRFVFEHDHEGPVLKSVRIG